MTRSLKTLTQQVYALEERIIRSSQVSPLAHLGTAGARRIISFVNPFSFQVLLQRQDVLDAVDDWYSDGALLCRTIRAGHGCPLPRYSFDFSSIADGVFAHAVQTDAAVALFGGAEIEATRSYLQERYPQLRIAWSRHGFFDNAAERADALRDLVASGAEIVILGMGTPLQEDVAIELRALAEVEDAPMQVIFTCGGFLSQTAQGGDYYPDFIKRTGLRWVYRAMKHSHVRKRLLVDYPRFFVQLAAVRLYHRFCG